MCGCSAMTISLSPLAVSQADAIAPCCDYNHRWERQIGVEAERIHTAYYGVDPEAFQPSELAPDDAPVVVWAGRIDPLKDVETLLGAAAVVKDARPDVRFLLYGAAPPGNGTPVAALAAISRRARSTLPRTSRNMRELEAHVGAQSGFAVRRALS